MNIYEWMVFEYPDDYKNDEDARNMFKQFLSEFEKPNPMHLGDCVKLPISCTLCIVSGLIDEYMEYCIENRDLLY
jgi:hypothetical protein